MLASHEKKKKRKKKRKRKTKHGRDKKKKKRNHESKHPSSDDSDDKPLRKSVTPMGGTSMALSRFLHQSGMQLQGGQQEGNEFQRDGTFDYAFDTDKEDHSCTSAFSKDHLHHLARKVSAEAIGVYFLVTTVGLCAAQGLDLGPVAVGTKINDNNNTLRPWQLVHITWHDAPRARTHHARAHTHTYTRACMHAYRLYGDVDDIYIRTH